MEEALVSKHLCKRIFQNKLHLFSWFAHIAIATIVIMKSSSPGNQVAHSKEFFDDSYLTDVDAGDIKKYASLWAMNALTQVQTKSSSLSRSGSARARNQFC